MRKIFYNDMINIKTRPKLTGGGKNICQNE